MKKVFLLTISLIFISLSSCSNDEANEVRSEKLNISEFSKEQIIDASVGVQLDYKRFHMKILASWVGKQNEEIISIMSNQKKLSKDDQQVFAIENLVKEVTKKQGTLSKSDEDYNQLLESLNAFVDLDDESWYPVIYLHKDTSINSKTNENSTYIAIEDADENGEKYIGYELKDDELVELQPPLTPELVGNNTLLVMSIQPCIAPPAPEQYSNCEGDGGGGGGGGTSGSVLRINQMKIKHLKEGWPGRSEIHFKGYKFSTPPNNNVDCGEYIYSSVNCYNYTGKRIVRLKRRWKNKTRTYNWAIKTENNLSNDVLIYVVFEHDSWPANKRTVYFDLPNGFYSEVSYRSWQGKYDSQMLSQNPNNSDDIPYANNFSSENSSISYNLRIN